MFLILSIYEKDMHKKYKNISERLTSSSRLIEINNTNTYIFLIFFKF